jgi:SAM-dependent methyltransferase
MLNYAKHLLRHSIPATCLAYMADDWLWGQRIAGGRNETSSGMAHAGLALEESIAIIENTYRAYLRYAGVERFQGRVVEIGPGDNLGVALLLAGSGASVVTVDRFHPRRDRDQEWRIYQALIARHRLSLRLDRTDAGIAIERVQSAIGKSAETFFAAETARFDAVLSNAVLEHLADPLAALDTMRDSLAPGGHLVHVIDLRDHGMFSGRTPLTFLTIPETIYRRMTRQSGRPNRVLFHDYRCWLERSRLPEARLLVSCLVTDWFAEEPVEFHRLPQSELNAAVTEVGNIRRRLAANLRRHADQEIAVAGCVLIARNSR